ncbi:hypothetical protein PUV54_06645 [Hyphococcus flavus]|uniref:Uncharacterized protein n=1 Tax=Hyphococcus flavus TaxID=1866326 RepID=A0AAE9ZDC5_9PROT|nr:hypothetical protein [Hyphococcus flavus]WDI32874.1 hypothetical protein PUV54_06645 [Hyphococcus flavus]
MTRAFRPAIFFTFILLLATPARAESALEHHTAPMLHAAAEKAAAFAENNYAFTVEHWSKEGDDEIVATVRFDPRREKGERWALLAPAYEDLNKAGRKALKALEKSKTEDHPLLYDKLNEMVEKAELVEETETHAVFVAQVDEDDFPKDALEVFITLDKAGEYVSSISVRSKKPFKPMPIAKVEHLIQTQHFAAPDEDGAPAFLARTEGIVSGEAMFRDFKSETRQVFSDIELVEIAADSAGE